MKNLKYSDGSATYVESLEKKIEELEKENTDLRYLIATKLEQQDGISLNSMAHPVTNTPEPSYEIDPDKLETIEIDLPSLEPVAWTDGKGNYFDKNSFFPVDDLIPLYTHPVKELTNDEILEVAVEAWGSGHEIFWFDDDGINLFARAILRKVQEK